MIRVTDSLICLCLILTACSPAQVKGGWDDWVEAGRKKAILAKHEMQKAKGRECAKQMKAFEGSTAQSVDRLLAFEFPDGVMSMPGKIQGQAKWDGSNYGNNCIFLKFEACAGVPIFYDNGWDHMSFAVTPSSSRNEHVINCAVKTLTGHFNVGFVGPDRRNLPDMDERPFQEIVAPFLAKSQPEK